jgi:dTMP kinase
MTAAGILIAVEGANGGAVRAAAHSLTTDGRRGAGISEWDASGLFEDMAVAPEEAGAPSARSLLLLYAADLAFRIRWEIRPALDEGRDVIAAPYVETAIAFGRAAGLPGGWLRNLFRFAPRPDETHRIEALLAHVADRRGFVEFGSERLVGTRSRLTTRQLIDRANRYIKPKASPSSPRW